MREKISPCPAYLLRGDTLYHIADGVGIVLEERRWEYDEPMHPIMRGSAETRLVSWDFSQAENSVASVSEAGLTSDRGDARGDLP